MLEATNTPPLLDQLSLEDARRELARCCESTSWVSGMLARRPFGSAEGVARAAGEVWSALGREDYLEAFAGHPAIGEAVESLRAKFAPTAAWASHEQAGVAAADEATLGALAAKNREYREKFGFIFIVCASGKSAREMLLALETRLQHEPGEELLVAAAEQAKITALRLEKLGRTAVRSTESSAVRSSDSTTARSSEKGE